MGCHGHQGRGNGASALRSTPRRSTGARAYQDDWGNPIVPRNLTRGLFRGGRRPIDIYRRIYAGINGTPMPALGESQGRQRRPAATPRGPVGVVHFVRCLTVDAPHAAPRPRRATRGARRTADSLAVAAPGGGPTPRRTRETSMRFLLSLLLLRRCSVLGVYTFVIAPEHGWWFPHDVSTLRRRTSTTLFYLILWMVGDHVRRHRGAAGLVRPPLLEEAPRQGRLHPRQPQARDDLDRGPGGAAALHRVLADGHLGRHQVPARASPPARALLARAPVRGGDRPASSTGASATPATDGVLGTVDDLENPFEFVVPVGENIVFHLRSRDVIHSFFVPAVPAQAGRAARTHDPGVVQRAPRPGTYDLVCAELCGWGHYKMAGRVRVVPRAGVRRLARQAAGELVQQRNGGPAVNPVTTPTAPRVEPGHAHAAPGRGSARDRPRAPRAPRARLPPQATSSRPTTR